MDISFILGLISYFVLDKIIKIIKNKINKN